MSWYKNKLYSRLSESSVFCCICSKEYSVHLCLRGLFLMISLVATKIPSGDLKKTCLGVPIFNPAQIQRNGCIDWLGKQLLTGLWNRPTNPIIQRHVCCIVKVGAAGKTLYMTTLIMENSLQCYTSPTGLKFDSWPSGISHFIKKLVGE